MRYFNDDLSSLDYCFEESLLRFRFGEFGEREALLDKIVPRMDPGASLKSWVDAEDFVQAKTDSDLPS